MNGHRDPVDSALDALKADDWSAAPFTHEQENQLMQHAQNSSNRPGIRSHRTLIAAVAVIAVGGVAFAATDGVGRLRTWLFDVEVGPDTRAKILVADGQTGTMIIENEDGTVTEIEATADELADGGMRTNVRVRKSDELGEQEDVHEVIRRRGPAPMEAAPLKALKNAELLATWSDEVERTVELYGKAPRDAEKAQLYIAVEGFEPMPKRRIVATPEVPAFFLEEKPTLTVDEADTITISFDTGDQVAVLKIATQTETNNEAIDPDAPVEIDGRDGEIRIRVEPGE